MEILLNQFIGYNLKAADGMIGRVADFYFDELSWSIKYLVVETDGLLQYDALISPSALLEPDINTKTFPVRTTISKAASVNCNEALHASFQYTSSLKRTKSVTGHMIKAPGTVQGKVFDFVVESNTWEIRYLVIKVEKSIMGKLLLIDSRHLTNVGWSSDVIELNL